MGGHGAAPHGPGRPPHGPDRPPLALQALLSLMRVALESNAAELAREGVRVKFAGETGRLPLALRAIVAAVERRTRANRRLLLTVACPYGARGDIAGAARELARSVAAGELAPEDVTEEALGSRMSTAEAGDVDLLIRTSGELRLSNFLLWESAYAELWFTGRCWPDFTEEELRDAMDSYARRDRRFGGRHAPPPPPAA